VKTHVPSANIATPPVLVLAVVGALAPKEPEVAENGSVVLTVVPLSVTVELIIEFAPLALGMTLVVKPVEVVLPLPEGVPQLLLPLESPWENCEPVQSVG